MDALLDRWFHQEWRDGYPVRYALLEECDDGERHQVEERWIWRFPWADLLNRRKRPPWWQPQPLKPPRVDKIDDYMRRHRFNIEGRRGVHRERETGYYRVLVYNGRWVRWLEGGDEGGIWFSDLARALSARDGEEDFYRELMKDRRQADIVAARAREEERIARGDWGL